MRSESLGCEVEPCREARSTEACWRSARVKDGLEAVLELDESAIVTV